jgi:N-acetylmuramoyl-L-alanine amidase
MWLKLIGAGLVAYGGYIMISEATFAARKNEWMAMEPVSADVDVLARTLWGEARGEGWSGMQAVANVVLNRVRIGGWYGAGVQGVCLKRWQFTCWEPAPLGNRERMLSVGPDNAAFSMALEVAAAAVSGTLPDITNGATHYHNATVNPSWAANATVSAVVGAHTFYSGVA